MPTSWLIMSIIALVLLGFMLISGRAIALGAGRLIAHREAAPRLYWGELALVILLAGTSLGFALIGARG